MSFIRPEITVGPKWISYISARICQHITYSYICYNSYISARICQHQRKLFSDSYHLVNAFDSIFIQEFTLVKENEFQLNYNLHMIVSLVFKPEN